MTSIGGSAFSGCSKLERITLPFVGESKKTANNTYQYPLGYIFGEKSYTGGNGIKQYYYGSSTSTYTTSTYYIPAALKSVTITGGNILYGAFWGCYGLTSVTIENGVTSIGGGAFSGCGGLTSIAIPNSVNSIGTSAFGDCSGLTSITVGDDNTAYASQDGVLYNKSKTIIIYVPEAISGSIIIPDGVTSINSYTFYYRSELTSITISDSVTSIGEGAFKGCSKLTSITFKGTKEQWNNIKKVSGWNSNTGNYTVYCDDGSIAKS